MAKELEKIQDLEGEVWKDIQGYEGMYQVSILNGCPTLKTVVMLS